MIAHTLVYISVVMTFLTPRSGSDQSRGLTRGVKGSRSKVNGSSNHVVEARHSMPANLDF